MKSSRACLSGLAVLILAGCASSAPDPMTSNRGPYGTPVQITVTNNDFNDAVVYANWSGGPRDRIGMVTGKTTETLTFPWRADVVVLDVDFVGGDGYAVDPIDVDQGDHLDLMILPRTGRRRATFADPATGQVPVAQPAAPAR